MWSFFGVGCCLDLGQRVVFDELYDDFGKLEFVRFLNEVCCIFDDDVFLVFGFWNFLLKWLVLVGCNWVVVVEGGEEGFFLVLVDFLGGEIGGLSWIVGCYGNVLWQDECFGFV